MASPQVLREHHCGKRAILRGHYCGKPAILREHRCGKPQSIAGFAVVSPPLSRLAPGLPGRSRSEAKRWRNLERETGIEPATNSLEGCDSTTELLPPSRPLSNRPRTSPTSPPAHATAPANLPSTSPAAWLLAASHVACDTGQPTQAKVGGEGRTRTFEAARATDLQSAAFDRFATSPTMCVFWIRCLRRLRCRPQSPGRWSWRRDLNPRPADYKSAALPD